MIFLSVFIQLFLTFFTVYKYLSQELLPESIKTSVVGNPEEFLEGMSLLQIVEKVHMELFLLSFVFLTLFSVNLRLHITDRWKILLSCISFFVLLIYFFSLLGMPLFPDILSYTYFLSFVFLTGILFAVNMLNIVFFFTGKVK
ncbi:MAG: hypothetical protein Q9M89_00750 [Persephonella sp.]|nr:hypothetical protein [Persephonella sp.]